MPKVSAKKKKPAARKPAAKKSSARKSTRRAPVRRRETLADRLQDLGALVSSYALVLAGGVGLIALVMLWAGGYVGRVGAYASDASAAVARGAGLAVARVTVRGRENISEADILDAVEVEAGQSLLHVDVAAAREKIEALGWVRSAAVARLWPDTVHVSVRERAPAAIWEDGGLLKLVDPQGAVIAVVGAGDYAGLPLITGAGAPEAAASVLAALEGAPDLFARVARLERVDDRRWDLQLRDGKIVRLPATEDDAAITLIAALQEDQGALDAPIELIDLTDPNNLIIRPLADAS